MRKFVTVGAGVLVAAGLVLGSSGAASAAVKPDPRKASVTYGKIGSVTLEKERTYGM